MKPITKMIFAGLGMAMGVAVLVMLIVVEEPNMKIMVMLLALGLAAQGISTVDQLGAEEEKRREESDGEK